MSTKNPELQAELRASVLDAAINLGIRNSMVARWMFEPVSESDENSEVRFSFDIHSLNARSQQIVVGASLLLFHSSHMSREV